MISVSQKLADGKCCVEADPSTYPYKVNIMSGPRLDRADDLQNVSLSDRIIATMQHCMLGLRTLVAASYIVGYIVGYRVRQCLSDVST